MVKNATQVAKKLTALIKSLKKQAGDHPTAGELPPTELLIQSILVEDASSDQVTAAMDALMSELVDYNELRVTATNEFVGIVGDSFPKAAEKSEALTKVLNAVFNDEHGVEMQKINELGKRDAKKYLEALDGMTPFLCSSMLLLHLEARAMPVDQALVDYLIAEGVLDEGEAYELSKVESFITSNVKAPELLATYYALRQGLDESLEAKKPARKKSSKKKTTKKAAKKTTKKTAKKTTKKASKKKSTRKKA